MKGVNVRVRDGFQCDLRFFFIVNVYFIQNKNFTNFNLCLFYSKRI